MQSPSGTAAARLSLWTLLAALLVAMVQPVHAGTAAAPEIADPANDQAILGEIPVSTQPPAGTTIGLSVDLLFGWVEEPAGDAASLLFTVQVQGTGGASSTSSQEWRYHFTVGGTEYIASAAVGIANVDGAYTVGGVTSEVTAAGDGLIIMKVPKSAIGNPAGGSVISGMFVEAESILATVVPGYITDRAPDADFGADYTMAGGSGGPTPDPNDTDGDGLNDTCEQQYFGDLTHNATEDADGDTLTNGQECALGTDPTKADTDGDGANDNVDSAPTDPTKGGTGTTTTSSSSSTSRSSTSSSTSTSRSSTSTGAGGSGDDGDVKNLGDALDRLQSDAGYLGLSGGGFLAVLILCIIALAVRWSL